MYILYRERYKINLNTLYLYRKRHKFKNNIIWNQNFMNSQQNLYKVKK
jgi:hypothetical protein